VLVGNIEIGRSLQVFEEVQGHPPHLLSYVLVVGSLAPPKSTMFDEILTAAVIAPGA
jgi:hypothetical protein